ncbi:copper amine oxidase [Acidimicrobiia bacterium EGI L10123]|uniref:copper amine oxidase n=1 Tax=Salinilacustrithrix flava TaxID=2957203 RepID=UPI003D7C20BA|nr:copper amine oxidase [Acidimicrobiia bacterium EGI L10123]
MRPTSKKLLAISLAASMALAACGGDDDTDVAQSGDPAPVEETTTTTESSDEMDMEEGETAGTETGAATLRANMTSLLQEHVYLAGIAIETALDAGGDMEAAPVQAAVATLDANSVALSEAIGSVAGDENAEAFLGLWREHIGFFVDYTLGKATGDQAAADQALTDLQGYQQAAGDFFEEITAGELPADALVESLDVHIETLTAAIDALVAGDAEAFDLLQAAADHMPMAATAIAGAVVAAVPDMFDGEVDSAPAETRAVLTDLLQEHVYLAGIAIEQAVEAGGDMEAPAVQAAVATLDANSVELAEVVGSVSTPEDQEAFLGLWREHIGFFVDYTLGKATGDDAAAEQALTDLDGYQQAAGDFFERITGGELPADALVASLDEHVATLTTAIDSLIAGETSVFDDLRAAGQHMPMAAAALSAAIVAATS